MLELSIDALLFVATYALAAASLHRLLFRLIGERSPPCERGKLAFEIGALLQFALWTPLALGAVDLPPLYLFAIPTARELFDVALLWVVERRSFTDHYRKFIAGHHLTSSLQRAMLAAVTLCLFSGEAIRECFQIQLLYYCCSIFLVAPFPAETLLLARRSPRARAVSRTVCFALARLSHVAVLPMVAVFAGNHLGAGPALGTTLLAGAVVAVSEYHSVVNGLPLLRKAWRSVACAPSPGARLGREPG